MAYVNSITTIILYVFSVKHDASSLLYYTSFSLSTLVSSVSGHLFKTQQKRSSQQISQAIEQLQRVDPICTLSARWWKIQQQTSIGWSLHKVCTDLRGPSSFGYRLSDNRISSLWEWGRQAIRHLMLRTELQPLSPISEMRDYCWVLVDS